jgi:hypothetical protein
MSSIWITLYNLPSHEVVEVEQIFFCCFLVPGLTRFLHVMGREEIPEK